MANADSQGDQEILVYQCKMQVSERGSALAPVPRDSNAEGPRAKLEEMLVSGIPKGTGLISFVFTDVIFSNSPPKDVFPAFYSAQPSNTEHFLICCLTN